MANVLTGTYLINKIKSDFGVTLAPAVERAYAAKLQDVITANPTATDAELDALLVNALMKLSLVRAELVKAFDENGNGKIDTLSELNITKGALDGTVDVAQADVANGGTQVTPGQTFMLAKGLDNVAGTAGNDTIIGSIDANNNELNTTSTLDIVNGGAGTDTLKISSAETNIVLPNMTNVEVVEVEGTAAVTVNTSAVAGVTNLNVTKAAGAVSATAAATTDVSVAVKAAGAATAVVGGNNVTVKVADVAANTNTIAVGATTAAKGAVVVEATAKAAVNGTNFTMGTIEVTGGKTVSVTQKVGDAAGLVAGAATATHTQGAVTVTADATTTDVTVKQDKAATAASTAAVTGVTEVASVKFSKLDAGESVTISGLTFTAAPGKNLTAEQVAQAFANLSASAIKPTQIDPAGTATSDTQGSGSSLNGTFTGSLLADWTSGAATGDTVVFTGKANTAMATDLVASAKATVSTTTQGVTAVTAANTLGVANGTVTVAGDAALKTVTIDGYAASTGAQGINGNSNNALATISLANGGNFGIDSAATTLGLTLSNVNGTVEVSAGTKTLNAVVNHAKATETSTLASASVEAVNVSGAGNVSGHTGDLTAAIAINTSGMTGGKATFTITDGTKTTYTGGAGADAVTISNADTAITKAVDLGAGDDTLTLNGAAVVPTATLNGGAGTDTISLSGARAEALSADNTFAGKIEGFEKLQVTAIAGAQTDTVNLSNMDDINYVIYAGSTASAATQEVQTFSVTNGVTATKTNEVQTIDFTGASITTVGVGSLTIGGVQIDTIADGDDAAAIATKVAAKLNNSVAVTGAGGFAVKATALGTGVTITYDTQSGDVNNISLVNTTQVSAGFGGVAIATATGFAANNVTVTAGVTNVTLTAQDKTATGTVVAGSGDDQASEVATKIVNALDLVNTYNATGTSNSSGDVTVTFAANADANNISLTAAGGVVFSAVTEATKGSAGGTLGNLTLTNMANNGTLEMAASASGATTTVTMKDATGSTDSLNLVTKVDASDLNFGTVDVANVEVLKLNAVDTTPGTAAAPTISTATLAVKADKATSLTIEGNSNVTLTLDAATTKLATIDASALTGALNVGNTLKAVTMTITGGSGADVLKASVGADAKADTINGGAGNDTIYAGTNGAKLTGGDGNDLFIVTANSATVGNKESNTYSEILDFKAGDLLQLQASNTVGNAAVDVGAFAKLAAVLNENTAVFSDFVNAAIKEAAAGNAVWFNYKGDAYVVVDSANNSTNDVFINNEDLVVKLVGINGDNLSWNSDYATVALI